MRFLQGILSFGIYRPISSLAVFIALFILGISSLPLNQLDLFPPLKVPVYRIITEYPDVPAEEVEKMVTLPLENILSTLGGVDEMKSLSRPGISSITLVFDWGSSQFGVGTAIRQRIDTIYPNLPDGIQRPVVVKQQLNDLPALTLGIIPIKGVTIESLDHIISNILKPQILALPGVGNCSIKGLRNEEILVEVDGEKLKASGLSIEKVAFLLRAALTPLPLGRVREGNRERPVISALETNSFEKLGSLPISTGNSTSSVSLHQIARIKKQARNSRAFFRCNGSDGIGISIKVRSGSGIIGTVNRIKANLPKWREEFSQSFTIMILEDTSLSILQSLKELVMTIALGGMACFFTLLVLFNSSRVSWISLLALPVALAITALIMTMAKITFNGVSLSGIALALGMVADNGIILLEGLYSIPYSRNTALPQDNSAHTPIEPCSEDKNTREKLALKVVSEAMEGIIGSTLTSTLIFLPILFIPGPLGKIFRDLSLSLCILLWASFFTSMLFIPAIFMLLEGRSNYKEAGTIPGKLSKRKAEHLSFRILMRVESWTGFFLGHGDVTITIGTVLFLLGAISLWILPYQLVPELPTGKIRGTLLLPPNTRVEETKEQVRFLESQLLKRREIDAVLIEAGAEREKLEDRSNIYAASHIARLSVSLTPESYRRTKDSIQKIADISHALGFYPLELTRRLPPIYSLLFQEKEGPLIATHPSRKILYSLLKGEMEPQLSDSQSLSVKKQYRFYPSPYFNQWLFHYENAAAETLGLSYSDIASPLRMSTEGIVISSFPDEGISKDLRLSQMFHQVNSIEKIKNIPLGPGSKVSVGDVGDFILSSSTRDLIRINRTPSIYLVPSSRRDVRKEDYPEGRDSFLSRLKRKGIRILPPAGQEYGPANILLFLLSLVLMYLTVGTQFNSFFIPLLLLFLVPLSASGSLTLLLITGKSLNLSSFLGIMITTGICLNGGIILFARFKRADKRAGIIKMLKDSVRSRTLSIIASSLTTLLSLVPMVFLYSGTNEFQIHCALAVIGGTIFSIPGVLIILPQLIQITYGKKPTRTT